MAGSQLSLDQLDNRLRELRLEINELPRNERELLTIQRKFNVNNELYTFLLKQKAESEITRAATAPNIRILNKARDFQAILLGPRRMRIYLMAVLITGILVFGIILTKFFLNDKISDLEQLKNQSVIPILTDIPHLKGTGGKGVTVADSPRGRLAEAFRNLRINLDFVVPAVGDRARVIGITSATSGEGKTFCAINLAHILALAGKKTLLIGLDLRKPKIQQELNLNENKGLSSFLIDAAHFNDVVQKSDAENLDVIASGPIPPNPTELIENGRLEKLLTEASQKYDYIIVDGPPIGLVTDYIAAANLIQTTLFVVRMNYSKFQSYKVLQDHVNKSILKNSHLIVNDVTNSAGGKYGYGYGYYAETEGSKSTWARLFRRKRG
nr:tyrosine-protein kinase family protein [Roseivirga sp. E12]